MLLYDIWKRVFHLSAGQCPITSCQRHSSAAGARDARFYPIMLWPPNSPDLKVVLAHISCDVGTLCIVLLSVCSGTCLPISIEIGLYMTDTEQKISWHVVFETQGTCTHTHTHTHTHTDCRDRTITSIVADFKKLHTWLLRCNGDL